MVLLEVLCLIVSFLSCSGTRLDTIGCYDVLSTCIVLKQCQPSGEYYIEEPDWLAVAEGWHQEVVQVDYCRAPGPGRPSLLRWALSRVVRMTFVSVYTATVSHVLYT